MAELTLNGAGRTLTATEDTRGTVIRISTESKSIGYYLMIHERRELARFLDEDAARYREALQRLADENASRRTQTEEATLVAIEVEQIARAALDG